MADNIHKAAKKELAHTYICLLEGKFEQGCMPTLRVGGKVPIEGAS